MQLTYSERLRQLTRRSRASETSTSACDVCGPVKISMAKEHALDNPGHTVTKTVTMVMVYQEV